MTREEILATGQNIVTSADTSDIKGYSILTYANRIYTLWQSKNNIDFKAIDSWDSTKKC